MLNSPAPSKGAFALASEEGGSALIIRREKMVSELAFKRGAIIYIYVYLSGSGAKTVFGIQTIILALRASLRTSSSEPPSVKWGRTHNFWSFPCSFTRLLVKVVDLVSFSVQSFAPSVSYRHAHTHTQEKCALIVCANARELETIPSPPTAATTAPSCHTMLSSPL